MLSNIGFNFDVIPDIHNNDNEISNVLYTINTDGKREGSLITEIPDVVTYKTNYYESEKHYPRQCILNGNNGINVLTFIFKDQDDRPLSFGGKEINLSIGIIQL